MPPLQQTALAVTVAAPTTAAGFVTAPTASPSGGTTAGSVAAPTATLAAAATSSFEDPVNFYDAVTAVAIGVTVLWFRGSVPCVTTPRLC